MNGAERICATLKRPRRGGRLRAAGDPEHHALRRDASLRPAQCGGVRRGRCGLHGQWLRARRRAGSVC